MGRIFWLIDLQRKVAPFPITELSLFLESGIVLDATLLFLSWIASQLFIFKANITVVWVF